MTRMTMSEAIIAAIEAEMASDESVYLMGQDVGVFGGPMQSSKGLWQKFGAEGRVIDAPISEASMVGTAVGAAMAGARPIIDLMFAEFIALTVTPLALEGASIGFKTQGRVTAPVVIRAKYGVGPHRGHPESLIGMLMGFPGLRVIVPTTPQDAYSMLRSAIRSDDIVVVLEHMSLLHGARSEVDTDLVIGLDTADIRRPGSDVTIVSSGLMVSRSLSAAKQLAGQGIEAELIDLRTLAPIDIDTIVASATRTGCLVVAEEAWPVAGPASEVVAQVIRRTLGRVPITFGFAEPPMTPVPFAVELEKSYLPSVADIVDAVKRTAEEHGRGQVRAELVMEER